MSDPAHKGPQISAGNQQSFGENIIPKFPRIIPVGTYGDEVQGNEQILSTLLSHCDGKAYAPLLLYGVIVDNTTAGYGKEHEDKGFRYIQVQVHELTSEHLAVRTPIAWVLFRKVLQKVAKRQSHCFIQASSCSGTSLWNSSRCCSQCSSFLPRTSCLSPLHPD